MTIIPGMREHVVCWHRHHRTGTLYQIYLEAPGRYRAYADNEAIYCGSNLPNAIATVESHKRGDDDPNPCWSDRNLTSLDLRNLANAKGA